MTTRRLTKKEIIESGIFYNAARFIQNDIIQKSCVSSANGINAIFSSTPELAILKGLYERDFQKSAISVDFPFFLSSDLEGILKLRDQEWHHFEDFRAHVSEVVAVTDPVQAKEAKRKLHYEVSKLEDRMQKHSREAKRKLFDASLISAMSITASILSAGMSTILTGIAGYLGGKHLPSTISSLRNNFDEPEELRESRLYFAWKVKKQIEKKV